MQCCSFTRRSTPGAPLQHHSPCLCLSQLCIHHGCVFITITKRIHHCHASNCRHAFTSSFSVTRVPAGNGYVSARASPGLLPVSNGSSLGKIIPAKSPPPPSHSTQLAANSRKPDLRVITSQSGKGLMHHLVSAAALLGHQLGWEWVPCQRTARRGIRCSKWWELAGAVLEGRAEKEGLDCCLHHAGWCRACTRQHSKLCVPHGGEGVVPAGAVAAGMGCWS